MTAKRLDLGSARENLAALKLKKGLKTTELASAAGLHHGSMSRFLSGGSSMPLDRFERLLTELGARIVIAWDEPGEEA